MRSLDEIASTIDTLIKAKLRGSVEVSGIVRTAEKDGKNVNYNKEGKNISFDDKYDNFLYHKVKGSSYVVFREKGKTKTYNVESSIDLYVYSKNRNSDDAIESILSGINGVTVSSIDRDSMAIFKREIGEDKFNPSHYIFVVNYQANYRTEDCLNCDECNN